MEVAAVSMAGQKVPEVEPEGNRMLVLRFNNLPAVQLLSGNRFMVTAPDGDIAKEEQGLFRDDTRFLSVYNVRINGQPASALSANYSTPYSAEFYLTNPDLPANFSKRKKAGDQEGDGVIPKESLVMARHRFIDRFVQEDYYIYNVSHSRLDVNLTFEFDADFLDLFDVKEKAFGNKPDMPKSKGGDHDHSKSITREYLDQENAFNFNWSDEETGFAAQTVVWFSEKGTVKSNNKMSYDLVLEPSGGNFHVIIGVAPFRGEERLTRRTTRAQIKQNQVQNYQTKVQDSIKRWRLAIPKLSTNWDELKHAYYQSLMGLISLQMSDPTGQGGNWTLPAAGTPWFMTLFGRDTLITAYQTLLFGPNLAKGTIESLAYYQATGTDANRDMEPGKILHEIRYGPYAAKSKRFPYYGTNDATLLFAILLSEIYRWTNDAQFVTRFKPNLMAALNWIDNYGDQDGDGFVEYKKKSPEGLDSQSWKDSWNSMQFHDGRVAEAPIATCEIQGYVYDAKMRAAEIARDAWNDNSLAKKLTDEANDLKKRFNEKYWIKEKGYYAIALDKNKDLVDGLSSNNGHLLWSGIVPEERVDPIVDKLMGESMFSGYGIRTLSNQDKGYSPIGYHNGTVWPHDNSFIALGLAQYGKWDEARRLSEGMLDAAPHYNFLYPEVFAGVRKDLSAFPVNYPTSCYPQAWASGATVLFVRTLLGIYPSRSKQTLELNPVIRSPETSIKLEGLEAYGKRFTVSMGGGMAPTVVLEKGEAAPSLF